MRTLLTLIAVFFAACVHSSVQEGTVNDSQKVNELEELGITLSVENDNVEVTVSSPVEDFLWLVFSTDREIMNAYVGNSPNFPTDDIPDIGSVETSIPGGSKLTCYAWAKLERHSGQCLVDMSKVKDFPQYVHFTYSNLSQSDLELVHKIIGSTRPRINNGVTR
jgi:hypothetical protein